MQRGYLWSSWRCILKRRFIHLSFSQLALSYSKGEKFIRVLSNTYHFSIANISSVCSCVLSRFGASISLVTISWFHRALQKLRGFIPNERPNIYVTVIHRLDTSGVTVRRIEVFSNSVGSIGSRNSSSLQHLWLCDDGTRGQHRGQISLSPILSRPETVYSSITIEKVWSCIHFYLREIFLGKSRREHFLCVSGVSSPTNDLILL